MVPNQGGIPSQKDLYPFRERNFTLQSSYDFNFFAFSTPFVFQDYWINFLKLVVLQCFAMNVFSHTGVLKNPKGSGQALLKETLFIFHLHFYLTSKPFLETT